MRCCVRPWIRGLLALSLGCTAACASESLVPEAPTCLTVETAARFSSTNIDRIDLLFVIDDSPSMVEEQAALQRELPAYVQRLVTGYDEAGTKLGAPHEDLHIGIVSADMGTGGFEHRVLGCGAWGDDGLFQHTPTGASCESDYPGFLSFIARPPILEPQPAQTPADFVDDFACLALPGTSGCRYTQPLESALMALWPAPYRDDYVRSDRETGLLVFHGDPNAGTTLGHGDREHRGFLRNEPREGLSMIGIVIVTDQDDCSVADFGFFGASAMSESPPLRCAEVESALHTVDRYVDGLKSLRPGNEQLIAVSVIAGVPPDLLQGVDDYASDNYVSFQLSTERDAFYRRVLDDPRMQVTAGADGTASPSCDTPAGRATAPRRLVQLAQAFGANGHLGSICDPDWSRALDELVPWGGTRPHHVCFPRPLRRAKDGRVDCQVVWELPLPTASAVAIDPFTITSCDDAPSVLSRDPEQPLSESGGQRCIMRQLAVAGAGDLAALEPGSGWYYDDFGDERLRVCTFGSKPALGFTEDAMPPTGVTVKLECVQTRFVVPSQGKLSVTARRPEPFDACDASDFDSCARELEDATGGLLLDGYDRTLSCDPERRECVLPCPRGECPSGWSCNQAPSPWCEPTECQVPG